MSLLAQNNQITMPNATLFISHDANMKMMLTRIFEFFKRSNNFINVVNFVIYVSLNCTFNVVKEQEMGFRVRAK